MALSDFSKYVYKIDQKSIDQENLSVCWHLHVSHVMTGSLRNDFECITTGYPLDYQMCENKFSSQRGREEGGFDWTPQPPLYPPLQPGQLQYYF